jgi:hypothetical protein
MLTGRDLLFYEKMTCEHLWLNPKNMRTFDIPEMSSGKYNSEIPAVKK